MALGMSKADVAVSATGITELVNTITKEWNNFAAIADPTGTEYKKMIAVLDTYWKGTDCENFKTQLAALCKDVKDKANECKFTETKAIEKYKTEFSNMQQRVSAKIPQGFK